MTQPQQFNEQVTDSQIVLRAKQAVADGEAHVPVRLGARPRCVPRVTARLPADAEAPEASPYDEFEPPLPQVQESHPWFRTHRPQSAVGERHHVHRPRGRLLLFASGDGRLLAQDRWLVSL